ncbi:MAG: tellurite resistance/C4-dicarboxylate transporter family protein [Thermoanaerobaculia bacterium]|nr:tellurite resistance/C4-dicarboxylate transporter family protein [Thermoanaerobaculia bacterium]
MTALQGNDAPATPARAAGGFDAWLSKMPPAYFALVMATGIVAIACQLANIPTLPRLLAGINLVAYAVLWLLTLLRLTRHTKALLADFSSHARGPGFFTTVAATSVVGTHLVILDQSFATARLLWGVAFVLWLLLTYTVFTALTIKEEKPSLGDGLNGGWLTAVVATQSLVVLGCASKIEFGGSREVVALALTSLWLAGGMLYIWMIALIFYRYTFLKFSPSDLSPPYWINMGAMAISTLAGALLVKAAPSSPLLTSLLPFLKGFTLLYWATASWWIPMLIVLGAWRHVARRVPLAYDPLYWGLVFPLGMYATATYRLSEVLDAPILMNVTTAFVAMACVAWTLTMIGMVGTIARGIAKAGAGADASEQA